MKRSVRGFTLLDTMVVVLILLGLAVIIVPPIVEQIRQNNQDELALVPVRNSMVLEVYHGPILPEVKNCLGTGDGNVICCPFGQEVVNYLTPSDGNWSSCETAKDANLSEEVQAPNMDMVPEVVLDPTFSEMMMATDQKAIAEKRYGMTDGQHELPLPECYQEQDGFRITDFTCKLVRHGECW